MSSSCCATWFWSIYNAAVERVYSILHSDIVYLSEKNLLQTKTGANVFIIKTYIHVIHTIILHRIRVTLYTYSFVQLSFLWFEQIVSSFTFISVYVQGSIHVLVCSCYTPTGHVILASQSRCSDPLSWLFHGETDHVCFSSYVFPANTSRWRLCIVRVGWR